MLKVLFFILILCAAIFVGPFLADEQGYVHIATQDYIIESSLTTAIILAIVTFIVLYFAIALIIKFIRIPRGTRSVLRHRQALKQSNLEQEAALYFEEGEYARALALVKRVKPQQRTAETYFIGAKAAFALQDYAQCSKFLDEVKGRSKEAFIASSIIRAKLNLQIGNAKAALEVLEELKKTYNSKEVTRLTYECYRKEQDVDKLKTLLPQLTRQKILTADEAAKVTRDDMGKLFTTSTSAELKDFYKNLDKASKRNPQVMAQVIKRLVTLDEVAVATKLTLNVLKKSLDPDFLESIATWDKSLPQVLSFLKAQAQSNLIASEVNTPLLKALGNLEYCNGEYKEAQEHLEKALQLNKSADTLLKLAKVMAAQRLFEQASDYYAKALSLQDAH